MQTFTSSATSINRSKLPAVYGKAKFTAPVVLDYGCGKYTDHIKEHLLTTCGAVLLPFDPYNQPEHVNEFAKQTVRRASAEHCPVDVVCSNVLNVIDDDGTILFITDQIETIVRRTGGTAYITVYEGNRSGTGKQTGKDQYQRNAPLRDYLQYFHSFSNATIKNGMIIVKGDN